MASKRKKRKMLDLYWVTIFVLVIGVLVGALFFGKYLGDRFISDENALQLDDTSIKTLTKPTIVPQNQNVSSTESVQVIVPPSFSVSPEKSFTPIESKPTPKETPKATPVVEEHDEIEDPTPGPEVADSSPDPEAVPVPEDSDSARTDSDLNQMVGQNPSSDTYEDPYEDPFEDDFERIELNDNSPAADVPEVNTPVETGDGVYKIQAGLYLSEDNAQQQAEDLSTDGYDATVVKVENPGGETYYRVQAGAFSNPDNAENMADDLQNSDYDVYIINE